MRAVQTAPGDRFPDTEKGLDDPSDALPVYRTAKFGFCRRLWLRWKAGIRRLRQRMDEIEPDEIWWLFLIFISSGSFLTHTKG
jgi:hypothetical protein